MDSRSCLLKQYKLFQELNIDIEYNERSLIIKMNDYGDLSLSILFTSRQIIIETSYLSCLQY